MGELGRLLETARRARGHSQAAAAAEIGVSQSAVSKWEKNDSSVDPGNVAALRRYLRKVSLHDIEAAIAADTEARQGATLPATRAEVEALRAEVASLAERVGRLEAWDD